MGERARRAALIVPMALMVACAVALVPVGGAKAVGVADGQVSAAASDATSLSPSIVKVTPNPFSPNNDRRSDVAKITYSLDRTQRVTWSITDRRGDELVSPRTLGEQPSGTHVFIFNGRDDNREDLPTGKYVVHLATTAVVDGLTATGEAQAPFDVDTTPPVLADVRLSDTNLYPHRDGYKDTIKFSGAIKESLDFAGVAVTDSAGRYIDTGVAVVLVGRRLNFTWNGTNKQDKPVRPGKYRLRLVALDLADNPNVTRPYTVTVSAKRLVKFTGKRTVSAKKSLAAVHSGACSRVVSPGIHKWKGSVGYLSDYYGCGVYNGDKDSAGTTHTMILPKAAKYGSVRVDTYGGASSGNSVLDAGVLIYYDSSTRPSDRASKILGVKVEQHRGPTVGGKSFVNGRGRFTWYAGTRFGAFYDVKNFTVRYTYYVLR